MEKSDPEKPVSEDGNQLNRNRSFKSKQLVRSQAIRESQSPPRTASPSSPASVDVTNNVAPSNVIVKNNVTVIGDRTCEDSSGEDVSEVTIENKDCGDEVKKQPVEIQITGGGWDEASEQRQRTRRWLGHRHYSDSSRDLLSNNPRVACVCGSCANCPHCRGRRRRHVCPIKQDSGIACSDDCPDCTDSDITGGHTDSLRKSESVEMEEQIYYCRCPERKERPKNASLSRTDSDERTEPTGPELVNFLKDTLNKNARDRVTLLKIEKELHALINDTGRCIVRFPVMTSYGRMLVHRCAALFQLSHHLDQSNKSSVTVSKSGTSGGRIPCTSFKQWCTANFPPSPQRLPPDITHAKSILKRDTHSLDEPGNGSLANSRSKSLEQREKDYERMKRRIFSSDNCAQDESQWPWLAGGPVKLLTPETGRNKLLKVQSLEGSGPAGAGAGAGRGPVSKSHSFGGYAASEPPHPRLLSRQGDLASSSWRLSPSSSGYKTLSLRSTDSVTPSPTGGASPEPTGGACAGGAGVGAGVAATGAVVWCVSDMSAVPAGALLLHPQTGRPLSNPDGSVYRFDPANPPTVYEQGYEETDNKIDQNEKKRGKLEKQHSFMDHGECECQPAEETPNKYCGECRRIDTDKNPPAHQEQIPQSPHKNRYKQPENTTDTKRTYESPAVPKPEVQRQTYEPTNRAYIQTTNGNNVPYEASHYTSERYEVPANQRPPYEQTNQGAEQRVKLTNQDSQEMQYNQYGHGIRPEEVTSPAERAQNPYAHADTHTMHPKGPVIPEHNLRQMSMANMIYPGVPHGYSYMNQCRMEQLQPMYAPAALPGEEHKQLAPSPHQEPTFRIVYPRPYYNSERSPDPSYPYAAVDYAAQCGACVDPNAINAMRSYNLSYGQVELPQPYPMQNVLVPQPQIHYYPYQEAVQWPPQPLMPLGGKLLMPEPCHMYGKPVAQYGLIYPQVIPQHYPLCQPLYPVVEKPSRRDSVGSRHSASTPRPEDAHGHVPHNLDKAQSRRNSNEIAIKIQQIKEQMAALDTGNGSRRARNSGHGILGSYPQPARGTSNDETQLSSAARAIVNSIRNMQAKSTYQDNRRDYNHYRPDRPDFRPRRPERQPENRFPEKEKTEAEMQFRDRRPPPFQGRPPQPHRQMSPGTWCRRSPGPVHPFLNHPRRPHPDSRNGRRQ